MRTTRILTAAVAAATALTLTACSSPSDEPADAADSPAADGAQFPITIEHALGTTTIEAKPERVATVNWANHEVPLALGVVPVGMAAANFGDDDGDGVLPWVVAEASDATDQFSGTISAEQVDTFSDVDVIVTYGGEDLVATLEGDPLLSQIPAVANGAIVSLPSDDPIGTAANPTPLAISWVLDDYVALLGEAAAAAAAAE